LVEIGAGDIPMIIAFNKIDMLKDPENAILKLEDYSNTYPISAKTGQGIEALLKALEDELFEAFIDIEAVIPYQEGRLISILHEFGQVRHTHNHEGGTRIVASIPRRLAYQFDEYLINESEEEEYLED
jgi:GTP-binding protein HflX